LEKLSEKQKTVLSGMIKKGIKKSIKLKGNKEKPKLKGNKNG